MSPALLSARCPAKVNLALRVLGRRPDGYHELDTVFQAIDLWDTIEIEPASTLSLVCDTPQLPTGSSNLVRRAAELLLERCARRPLGAALRLSKAIPLEAGLGGGSSDAAGALLLCSRFWNLGTSPESLLALAAELGADVPFFLHGGTARGTARGDRIAPLPPAGEVHFLLGCPPFGISTAEVFRRVGTRLTLPGNGVSLPVRLSHKWMEQNDFGFMANDLEAVVFEDWPALADFRDALLEEGSMRVSLSGSGSTVYGIFPSSGKMEASANRLSARFPGWRLVATRSVECGAHVVDRGGGADAAGGGT